MVMLPKGPKFGKHCVPLTNGEKPWRGYCGVRDEGPWSLRKPCSCSTAMTTGGQHGPSFCCPRSFVPGQLTGWRAGRFTPSPPLLGIHLSLETLKRRSGTHALQNYLGIQKLLCC